MHAKSVLVTTLADHLENWVNLRIRFAHYAKSGEERACAYTRHATIPRMDDVTAGQQKRKKKETNISPIC